MRLNSGYQLRSRGARRAFSCVMKFFEQPVEVEPHPQAGARVGHPRPLPALAGPVERRKAELQDALPGQKRGDHLRSPPFLFARSLG